MYQLHSQNPIQIYWFCQGDIQQEFIHNLNLLYDEKYKKQKNELNILKSDFDNICNEINKIIKENSIILNNSQLIIDITDYINSIEQEITEKITNPKYVCNINKRSYTR